ncbi:uncharacterized protein CEXT_272281 [Caerostris extrusa]|uniref:Uncharacterized protein n=1 Tax=Caerostris extrusa TaxID=172846 RepID=A0AAV4SYR6_CAEEX|nr:uncharacterized protein CEXT_272281 [Caerostris extrusa]
MGCFILGIDDVVLLPLYPCDSYDESKRSCTNIRQVGTTLTVGVNIDGSKESKENYFVRWFRFFKVMHTGTQIKEEFTMERKPWNINLGEEGKELRISPITETDYSYNFFVALLMRRHPNLKPGNLDTVHYLQFYIEPTAIDMGILYYGEELFINARSFIELPEESVQFRWRQSILDSPSNLTQKSREIASNMMKNADGSALIIKEFMGSVDKILTCGIYSNKNIFIARRDFRLQKIDDEGKSDNLEFINEKTSKTNRDTSRDDSKESSAENSDELLPSYSNHEPEYQKHYKIPKGNSYRENNFYESDRELNSDNDKSLNSNRELPKIPDKTLSSYNNQDSQYLQRTIQDKDKSDEGIRNSVVREDDSDESLFSLQHP